MSSRFAVRYELKGAWDYPDSDILDIRVFSRGPNLLAGEFISVRTRLVPLYLFSKSLMRFRFDDLDIYGYSGNLRM